MDRQPEIVVIGAGHNGLTAAAYLVRAGLSVTVLEAADRVGGKAATDEPLLPGFRHNPHANALIFCDVMPVIGELDLPRHGLRTLCPEAQLGVAFSDGRPPVVLHRHDLVGRTVASLGVYSKADARTYRDLKRRSAALNPLIARGLYNPPSAAWFEDQAATVRRSFGAMCSAATLGGRSARELIDDLFRSPEVRMLFYHLALECGLALEETGGDLAFLGLAVWIAGRWRLPVGGMQSFSDALAAAASAAGAEVRLGTAVRRVVTEGRRAVAVETEDGSVIQAGRAVVAATPILELLKELVDPRAVSREEQAELSRMQGEQGGAVATSVFCLATPPRYKSARHDPEINRCFKTIVGHDSPEDVISYAADVALGLLPRPAGTVRVNSLWDPSQAPASQHVAGVDSLFPPLASLDADTWRQVEDSFPTAFLEVWSRYAANIGPASTLASACDATARFERRMLLRSGSAQYRTSVSHLYMCGPGTFPGGGVHGACGYNASQVVAEDLGLGRPLGPNAGAVQTG